MELKETMPLQEIAEKIAFKADNKPDSPALVIMEQLNHKYFDPYELDAVAAWQNIPKPERDAFFNTIRTIPLADMLRATNPRTMGTVNPHLREFLASSGTTGIAGAYYMIPVKLWDQMQTEAVEEDVVAAISKVFVGPESIPGTTMKIDVAKDGQYIFNDSSSGAIAPTETIETVQATLDFSNVYTCNFRIGNDLIEDAQFDTISMHVSEAGRQAGEKASDLALTILKTAADGDGVVNGGASGDAAETMWRGATTTAIEDLVVANVADGFRPDTMVINEGACMHSVFATAGAQYAEASVQDRWIINGWPTQLGGMSIIYSGVDTLTNSKVGDNLVTIAFRKDAALFSGRKRWLRMEKYSEPVKDLTGAVISFRQDSVTLYNDAIGVITET